MRQNEYEQHVDRALTRMSGFCHALNFKDDRGVRPFHLPCRISDKITSDVNALLAHYSWLAKSSVDNGVMLWAVVPKHHYMWHLAQEAKDMNPRMTWCYANEDVVGKLAVIGMSTRHGLAAAYRSRSLGNRYILGITLRLIHNIAD